MTVAELIEELRTLPPDTPVLAWDDGDEEWTTSVEVVHPGYIAGVGLISAG
jgi:hypothetical protein